MLNAELGADFDPDEFEHVARLGRREPSGSRCGCARWPIRPCTCRPSGSPWHFAAGEEMRTEISAKFRRAGVEAELAAAGLAMRSWWTDSAAQFGLSLSVPA